MVQVLVQNWENINNISYLTVKDERAFGKMTHSEIGFIVLRNPHKAVVKLSEDDDHDYVLYDTEVSRTHALYIPDGFPFTNLWLDIYGGIFMGTNHYTVTGTGFDFIFDILERHLERHPESFKCSKQMRGDKQWLVVEASSNDFGYVKYQAEPGENVIEISEKLGVSAYLILERNRTLDGYNADCSGLTLEVPNQFAKKVKVEISPVHGIPVRIEIFDDQGLLERFHYKDIRINTKLPTDLFTEDYLEDLE